MPSCPSAARSKHNRSPKSRCLAQNPKSPTHPKMNYSHLLCGWNRDQSLDAGLPIAAWSSNRRPPPSLSLHGTSHAPTSPRIMQGCSSSCQRRTHLTVPASHTHLVFHQTLHTVIEGDPLRKVGHLGWNALLGRGGALAAGPSEPTLFTDCLRVLEQRSVAKTRIPKPARTACGIGVHRTWSSGCRSNRPEARTTPAVLAALIRCSHYPTRSCTVQTATPGS